MDNALIEEWGEAKTALANSKAAEMELRLKICKHILDGKKKGAKKGVIGKYVLTATAKLGTKVDKDALKSIWPNLSKEERAAIRFKPDVDAKEYKKLDKKSILHQVITSKPGTPSLELKGFV